MRHHIKSLIICSLFPVLLSVSYFSFSQTEFSVKIDSLCNESIKFSDSLDNKAIRLAEKAVNIAKLFGDSCILAKPYYAKGIALQSKSRFKQAAEYYLKTFEISKTCKDYLSAIKTANNLGVLNKMTGEYKAADNWYSKALSLSSYTNDTEGEIHALNNLGNLSAKRKRHTEAIKNYRKSLSLMRKHPEHKTDRSSVHINAGWVYYAAGMKDSSVFHYNKALQILRDNSNPYVKAVCLKNIAEIMLENNNQRQALWKLKEAEKLYQQFDNKSSKANLFKLLYETYSELGNYKRAFDYLKSYTSLSDSIDKNEMHAMLKDIEEKYKNEKLKKEKLIQESKLIKRKRYIVLFSITIIFLIIFAVVLIYLSRERKRHNEKLRSRNKIINEGLKYGQYVKHKLMKVRVDKLSNYIKDYFLIDIPCETVGGDFYLFREKDEFLFVLCGDATGHGVPGGFISQTVLHLFDEELINNSDPESIISNVRKKWNEKSSSDNMFDDSFTASLLRIDKKQETKISVFGQKAIYSKNQTFTVLKSLKRKEIYTENLKLEKDDKIFLSSDGYYDQIGGVNNKPMKFKNYRQILEKNDKACAEEMKAILIREVEKYKGGNSQTDDILITGIYF